MTALTRSRTAQAPRPTRGVLGTLMTLDAAWRSRRALGRLASERLEDVGLTPADARGHAERPSWDAPSGWLR